MGICSVPPAVATHRLQLAIIAVSQSRDTLRKRIMIKITASDLTCEHISVNEENDTVNVFADGLVIASVRFENERTVYDFDPKYHCAQNVTHVAQLIEALVSP